MRSWLVLLLCLWAVHCKRLDSSMIDPLMRRSPLDKNFMRFGRSSPPLQPEEVDKAPDYGLLRPVRAKDNFIRFGRGKQDNFMRFGKAIEGNNGYGSGEGDTYTRYGRGKQDNFMRFGRSKQDNFMRFGRGKQDNFMRFGRLKQDNFMRFGRGKQDNFMRFGRGKQGNFMRFGRGKQDNFMRFGKSKDDNFMRFGRGFGDPESLIPEEPDNSKIQEDELFRDSRGKQDNFMRFGKSSFEDPDNEIPIAMRSVDPKFNSNFIRFGRGKQDNFMRFGKSDGEKDIMSELEDPKEKSDYPGLSGEEFTRESKSKDSNLLRFGRHPPSKDDSFMRFGRSQDSHLQNNSPDELIPPRLKRSISYTPEDDNDDIFPFVSLPDELEEEYSASDQPDDFASRKKRSISDQSSTAPPFLEEDAALDFVTAKLRLHSPDQNGYPASSLLAAGLPNVIVGPEFSLLPDLDSPSPHHPADQSFLRFG